jgi:hypothetical protein
MKSIDNSMGCEMGPTYFEGLVTKIEKNCECIEWRAKLNAKFVQIKFYGEYKFYGNYKYKLIGSTEFSPQKVTSIDNSGNEILLFDGCTHGYNAIMLCDEYTEVQINQRVTDKTLILENIEEFEVILSAYYQVNFDEEFAEDIDENEMFKLKDDLLVPLTIIKRNGFDFFQIIIQEKSGKCYPILQEELA